MKHSLLSLTLAVALLPALLPCRAATAQRSPRKVYMSFILHGNMNYDRYVRTTIWEQFPVIYDNLLDFIEAHPDFKGQVQFSGQTAGSLMKTAPEVLTHALALQEKGQLNLTGTFYSEPVNVNMDGETNFRCAWLGTKIIGQIAGTTDGFYLQERAYHPQLPWILRESDVSWVPVIAGDDVFRPFRLKGMDGSYSVCVPTSREHLMEKVARAPADALIVIEEDYEIPQHFSDTYEQVARFNAEHPDIQVEWITVKDYIARFGLGEERYVDHTVKARSPENGTYSRWTADPLDIRVQEATNAAMADLRAARMLNALMAGCTGAPVDQPFSEAGILLERDPLTWNIEHTDLYPEVEERFLARDGKVTVLSKAEHLLLWAVNSDAKGWFPLYERRRERVWSLHTSSELSKSLIYKALDRLAEGMRLKGYDKYYLVASMEQARNACVRFEEDFPCRFYDCASGAELPSSSHSDGGKRIHEVEVALPAFGYKVIGARRADAPDNHPWMPGERIESDGISLTVEGDKVLLERGGRQMEIRLDPFLVKTLAEVTAGKDDAAWRSAAPYGPVRSSVRQLDGACQLRLLSQPDWQVHLEQVYTIRRGSVICDLAFTFPNPCLIRRHGDFQGLSYRPEGLDFVVETSRGGTPFFDIPFGISEGVDGVSYLCPLSTCFLQQDGGGLVVSPQTGEQAFRVDAAQGAVTVFLGASTTSGPIHEVGLTFEGPTRVHHEPAWYSEPFHGTYTHRIILHPYDGDWESEHIPLVFRNLSAPVYVRECRQGAARKSGRRPVEASLLRMDAPDVNVTMMDTAPDGGTRFRLNGRTGKTCTVTLEAGGRKATVNVPPYGIVTGTLE